MTWSDLPGDEALPNLKDSGEDILQLGKGIANAGTAMRETQIIGVGGEVEGWTGLAATAHQGQATFLQQVVQKAIDIHPNIPTLLNKYVQEHAKARGTISNLQHDWNEAINTRNRKISELAMQMKDGLYPGTMYEYDEDKAKANKACEKTQEDLKRKYKSAIHALDQVAIDTGTSIFNLAKSFGGVRADKNNNVSIDRNNLGVKLFGKSGGVLAAQTRWEDAKADAKTAAKSLTTKDGHLKTNISQKELNDFSIAYGKRMATDPFFANAFGLALGANNTVKLASLVSELGGNISLDSSRKMRAILGSSLILTTGGIRNGLDADGRSLWNAWKAGLNGFNYDGHTPLKEERESYLDSLKKLGPKQWSSEEESPKSHTKSGYELISGMIADAATSDKHLALGDDFLNGKHAIADDIVQYDHKHPYTEIPSANYLPPATKTWDPLQNMLVGMDGNPSASRDFLANKTPFDVEGNHGRPMSMARYLVGHRPGITDLRHEDELSYTDNGVALANVIDDASSDKTQPQSAYIVREFLNGYADGLARSDDEHDGQESFGYYNHGLRYKAGDILKEYGSDFANEIHSPTGVAGATEGREEGNEYHLALTKEQVLAMHRADSDFFKDIAFSKEAKSTLVNSLEKGLEEELKNEYDRNNGTLSLAEVKDSTDDIRYRYQNSFKTINGGEIAAEAASKEDEDQSTANTINGMKAIGYTAAVTPPGRTAGIIVEAVKNVVDFGTSQDDNPLKDVYDKHKTDDLMTRFHVDRIHDKVINRVLINGPHEGYYRDAKKVNDALPSARHRFLDENGNWLIKVDPKTGEVKGDALRVQEYNDFIENWKP